MLPKGPFGPILTLQLKPPKSLRFPVGPALARDSPWPLQPSCPSCPYAVVITMAGQPMDYLSEISLALAPSEPSSAHLMPPSIGFHVFSEENAAAPNSRGGFSMFGRSHPCLAANLPATGHLSRASMPRTDKSTASSICEFGGNLHALVVQNFHQYFAPASKPLYASLWAPSRGSLASNPACPPHRSCTS